MSFRAGAPKIVPGDALLDPVAIAAIGLLLLNDHVLKALWPGALTGKLSDFAGLAFFPLLLVGAWELVAARLERPEADRATAVAIAVAATAIAFALVKTTAIGADAYAWGLGGAQWLTHLCLTAIGGGAAGSILPVTVARDPTDLLALTALVIPLAIGRRRH